MILIYPAIDLSGGKCVRLIQGVAGTEKIYCDDPVKMAVLWRGENFKTIHVVDLDGAFGGSMKNFEVIEHMVKAVDIPIQVGGGIRTMDQCARLFDAGVCRVVLGTIALENPDLLQELLAKYSTRKIIVGIDAKKGIVKTKGWTEDTGVPAVSLGLNMKELGIKRIVYTDIARDGMMVGPNIDAIREMAEKTGLRITASGGVSGYRDLMRLAPLEEVGVDSIIIGKALYENRFPCQALWRDVEKDLTDFGPTRRT